MIKEKKKIFVIEDSEPTLKLIEKIFLDAGFAVSSSKTGKEGFLEIKKVKPDVIILDLILPDINGNEIGKMLKSDIETADIPIIVVSAKNEVFDIIKGLESFADNYMTKPFNDKLLLAHTKAMLRRSSRIFPSGNDGNFVIYGLNIDSNAYTVRKGLKDIDLTKTEFEILILLSRRPGWVFTREQIIRTVHGDDFPVTERAIDVSIVRLRKKLGKSGRYIETVRGMGYRFRHE